MENNNDLLGGIPWYKSFNFWILVIIFFCLAVFVLAFFSFFLPLFTPKFASYIKIAALFLFVIIFALGIGSADPMTPRSKD